MSDTNRALQTLRLALVEADQLYNSPWPDCDLLGPDAKSPQLMAALKLFEALGDFLRAVFPDAPRGVMTEICGAAVDLAEGRARRLFQRTRKAGAPFMPFLDECAMGLLSATTDLLVEGGMQQKEALQKVSRAAGTEANTIRRFRANRHRRSSDITGLSVELKQGLMALEVENYKRACAILFASPNINDPDVIKKIKEVAGRKACATLSNKNQFCPSARRVRREPGGSLRGRVGGDAQRGAGAGGGARSPINPVL